MHKHPSDIDTSKSDRRLQRTLDRLKRLIENQISELEAGQRARGITRRRRRAMRPK